MAFFVAKNETELDAVMAPEVLMKSAPDYYAPRFEAIKDLRQTDDGSLHKGNEFRRVASFVNVPLFMAAKLADPDFLKNKRALYAFMDRNPQYLTYDRRNRGRGTAKDDLKLPLSALGLEMPGTSLKVTEKFVPIADVVDEATGSCATAGGDHGAEHVPDSAEGTVGE